MNWKALAYAVLTIAAIAMATLFIFFLIYLQEEQGIWWPLVPTGAVILLAMSWAMYRTYDN